MIAYVAAKASVAAITQALAAELLAEDILVNAVLPSVIDTPANRVAMPNANHGTWPKPAQLAQAIAFLVGVLGMIRASMKWSQGAPDAGEAVKQAGVGVVLAAVAVGLVELVYRTAAG